VQVDEHDLPKGDLPKGCRWIRNDTGMWMQECKEEPTAFEAAKTLSEKMLGIIRVTDPVPTDHVVKPHEISNDMIGMGGDIDNMQLFGLPVIRDYLSRMQ